MVSHEVLLSAARRFLAGWTVAPKKGDPCHIFRIDRNQPDLLEKKKPNLEYFDEVVNSLGLFDKLEALPNQLSGGQQQRTAIARSLIYRPALLLADEPIGNLDRKNSKEIMDMLKLSNRNLKQTILLITHDENIALEADHIVTIEDGRIIRDQKRGGR